MARHPRKGKSSITSSSHDVVRGTKKAGVTKRKR